ncbi:hypothetical protein MTR62_12765 [Novosphingobium sp. 1949]|uniref:Uncharacterized protein n=1 Tax=Novosphingobium organovorum TaxID=2930092 RepID=A0ABT0BFJ4_9SPHN|nr:hypothetical protein [Novosphingobium organovorum]MCJ2183556.1 hypothetical protein [Novosphingobium organovorum]
MHSPFTIPRRATYRPTLAAALRSKSKFRQGLPAGSRATAAPRTPPSFHRATPPKAMATQSLTRVPWAQPPGAGSTEIFRGLVIALPISLALWAGIAALVSAAWN